MTVAWFWVEEGHSQGKKQRILHSYLTVGEKKLQMGEENLYSYLPTKKSLHELEFNGMFGIPMRSQCAHHQ